MRPTDVRSRAPRKTLALWMASSLVLAACGGVEGEAAGTSAPELMEGQQAQEATAERRVILYRTPAGELYIDNNGVQQLVAPRGTPPVFSPDGRRAAFSRLPDAWNVGDPVASAELHVVDLSSRRVERVTSGHADLMPVWTPDSRYLFFVSTTRAEGPSFWRVKMNGSDLQPLSLPGQSVAGAEADGRPQERRVILYIAPPADGEVKWKPTERRVILYRTARPSGVSEIVTAVFNHTFDVQEARTLGEGMNPYWTADGKAAFTRPDGTAVEMSVE